MAWHLHGDKCSSIWLTKDQRKSLPNENKKALCEAELASSHLHNDKCPSELWEGYFGLWPFLHVLFAISTWLVNHRGPVDRIWKWSFSYWHLVKSLERGMVKSYSEPLEQLVAWHEPSSWSGTIYSSIKLAFGQDQTWQLAMAELNITIGSAGGLAPLRSRHDCSNYHIIGAAGGLATPGSGHDCSNIDTIGAAGVLAPLRSCMTAVWSHYLRSWWPGNASLFAGKNPAFK